VQDVHDIGGVEVLAPLEVDIQPRGTRVSLLRKSSYPNVEEELIQQKVNDVMTSNER
jgi:hypothetical protein